MIIAYLGNIICLSLLLILAYSLYSYLFKNRICLGDIRLVGVLLIIGFFLLIYGFVTSNFALELVLNNSHSTKPLIYKIAAVWGNHEGSFFLLTSLIGGVAMLLRSKAKKHHIEKQYYFILNSILFFLVTYIYLASNPFLLADQIGSEGSGLNPVLQDVFLAIHPPILYIGQAIFIVNFIVILAFLLRAQEIKKSDFYLIFYLVSWAEFFLSIGIILGSFWAYKELGWGGFWFWDPVENVALMPWLLGLILLHFVMIAKRKDKWHSLTILLSLLTAYFCFIGFFLVRSGVLQSVHSFASDPTRGMFLLIILTLFIAFSLLLYKRNLKKIIREDTQDRKMRYTLIKLNYYLILAILAVIFLATIYPLIMQIFRYHVTIGADYYNKSIAPLVISLIISMVLLNYTNWQGILDRKKQFLLSMSFLLSFALTFMVMQKFYMVSLVVLAFLGSLLLFNMILGYFLALKAGESNLPMFIGHAAFGLLIFSLALFAAHKKEGNFLLKPGEEITFQNYHIHFETYSFAEKENYLSVAAKFSIYDQDNNLNILEPEKRIYFSNRGETSEAAIMNDGFADFYIVFSKFYGDSIKLRVYINPFMNFIWLSFILIAISFFIKPVQKLVLCRREAL